MIILLICILTQVIACFRISKEKTIDYNLTIALIFFVFLWYFLPGTLALIRPEDTISTSYTADKNDFITAYLLETLALLFILIGFAKCSRHLAKKSKFQYSSSGINKVSAIIIIVLFSALMAYQIARGHFDYLEGNSAMLYDAGRGFDSIVGLLTGFVLAAVFLLAQWSPTHKWIFFVSFVLICTSALFSILVGGRIGFLLPIEVLAFKYIMKRHFYKRAFILAFFILFFVWVFVLPVSYLIGQLRQDLQNKINISYIFDSNMFHVNSNDLINMLFVKFDSFSYGYSLVQIDGLASAGLKPYYGSALVFIPRFIWPDRPVAGSADGTIYGHPSRMAPVVRGVFSDSLNVGISPLFITLWELGVLGFPVFIISGICFLLFINKLLKSSSFYSKVIGVFLFGIPSFYQLLPSSDVMLRQVVTVIPILAGFWLYRQVLGQRAFRQHEKGNSTH